jgi:hypothetical protein
MRFSILFLLSVFLCIQCSSTGNKLIAAEKTNSAIPPKGNTSIYWKPNVLTEDFLVESLSVFQNIDIGIKPLSDSRTNKETIGTIIQNGQPITVITRIDISNWCTKNLIKGFQFLGLKSISNNGSFSFEGEVTSFSIQQDITMSGEISMSLSCIKDGLTVWEGRIEGHSELYVIPTGSDGVSECMSNTLINAVYKLLNDKSFVDAIKKSSN